MATRYTYRIMPGGDQSPKRMWSIVGPRVARHLFGRGPVTLEYGGERFSRRHSVPDALARTKQILQQRGGHDRVILRPAKGRAIAVRKFEVEKKPPLPNIYATVPLLRIIAAVNNKFDNVRSMGIAANKPGEHGVNPPNAWDVGTDPNVPATVTWARIEAYAKYLRAQGIAHQVSGGRLGLPVNGVIYQQRYWQRGMGLTWAFYSGTPHVSHVHVSGHPSKTGWI